MTKIFNLITNFMKLKLLLCFLGCCCSLQINAQQAATGRVVNALSGQAIAGATVRMANGAAIATAADGSFRIRWDEITDSVTISHIGFETVTLLLTGQMLVRLQPAVAVLQEVVVSTGYQTLP